MRHLEIRHLRYFVAVAEELSFSKAALRLHMSQPPLSQQIKALEEGMGVQLFDRSRREVHLTEAGRVFLIESKRILSSLEQAVGLSVRAASVDAGKLRVGLVTTALFHLLPAIHKRVAQQFPAIELNIYDMSSRDQIEAIQRGRLDIGIVHSCTEVSGINKIPLFTEPFVLALPAGHELASEIAIDTATIEKYPLIAFSRDYAPSLYDAQLACCLARGFRPNLVHSARSAFTIFLLIRQGFGISLVPKLYSKVTVPGVVFKTLEEGAGHLNLFAIWSEANASDLISRVIENIMSEPL